MQEIRSRRRQPRKKKKPEESGKPSFIKKVETVIIKHLLRIFGILFILASLFYAVSSADKLLGVLQTMKSSDKVLASAPETAPAASAVVAAPVPADAGAMMLWGGLAAAAVLALLLISVKFRWREIPRILLVVFYAAVIFIARHFGWQAHLIFPLIAFFSILLYINGTRLHSTLAVKANVVIAWTVFGVWFVLKVVMGADRTMLLPFFVYSGLLFVMFLGTGVYKGFSGHHRSSPYTEVAVASFNLFFYFLFCSLVLFKFGFREYLWLYCLSLGLLIAGVLFVTDRTSISYNRDPYLFATILLLSLVFPFLFTVNFIILLFAVLSVFLLLYSRFSKNQPAVLFSFGAMTIMLLVYLQNWIFQYFPAAFLGDITIHTDLYNKGLVATLVILPAFFCNVYLLKSIEITLSKNWFSRKTYLRMFKGILLVLSYLGIYWIINYPLMGLLSGDQARFLIWFAYSSLFFIIALPVLDHQKSSFLQGMVWFSLIISIAYPLLVHLFVLELRNEFLKHDFFSPAGFYFHYAALFLLIVNLAVTSRYIPRIFKESNAMVQVVWTYFILMGLFLLLSEFDHTMVITGLKKGVRIEDITAANRKLPYTIILMCYSLAILVGGLISHNRFFRATALVMLTAALIKVFYTDLSSLEGNGKVILLFVLGTVVLVISFFYTRIRRLFSDQEAPQHSHHHRRRKEQDVDGQVSGGQASGGQDEVTP